MFEQQIAAVKAHTPKDGVSLCGIDDFEEPPDNLYRICDFDNAKQARFMASEPDYVGKKLIIIFPDGHIETP